MEIDPFFDRRAFLSGLFASSLVTPVAFASDGRPTFASCCRLPNGRYAVAVLDEAANVLFTETLEGRGHDIAVHPDRRMVVVFARRPGRFAVVIDLQDQRRVRAFTPPSDRHFYGHGFFSNDGRLLFTTENDFEAERGCLGIYDATKGFTRIGEFNSGGIGPHEALLLSDGKTIAVANGGIATHPDYPRQKLNLAEMRPSITLIDVESGDLFETIELPRTYRQLSIRHIAEAGDGSLWFGGQYEGSPTDLIPLVGRYRRGNGIELIEAPDHLYRGMNQYVGSVAVSQDGTQIATSSPRGGVALIWDAATLRPLDQRSIADVCGVAASGSGFLFSDGQGSMQKHEIRRRQSLAWDNHLAVINS